MGEIEDAAAFAKRMAESASKVKFAPGVIGKTSMLNLALICAWAIVFWRFDPNHLLAGGAMFLGAVVLTVYVRDENKKNREFAAAHPTLALMEGAQITEHKRLEIEAAKGIPAIERAALTTNPSAGAIERKDK